MAPYKCAGKYEANSLEEFSRQALELPAGVRLSCIELHQMMPDSSVPYRCDLIVKLAMERGKPYWMMRGLLRDPKQSVSRGYFMDENKVPVRVSALGVGIDATLLSIIESQVPEKDRFSELAILTRDLAQDYASVLDGTNMLDVLYQTPDGRLFGQTTHCGTLIEGSVHLATFSRTPTGKYTWGAVNQPV
ncbi:MAG: hypothetical protein Q7K43_00010 [Candidatus Woesearchaeota archaeon]|nr:hypothetical protein [Candidatus Woesearchaeota archaeon]